MKPLWPFLIVGGWIALMMLITVFNIGFYVYWHRRRVRAEKRLAAMGVYHH